MSLVFIGVLAFVAVGDRIQTGKWGAGIGILCMVIMALALVGASSVFYSLEGIYLRRKNRSTPPADRVAELRPLGSSHVSSHYPNAKLTLLNSDVAAFVTSVDDLFGHYLDSTSGFVANQKQMVERQERTRATLPAQTDLDSLAFFYGVGNPNDPSNRLLHRTTQGDFKTRNAKGGRNHVRAGQLLIVLLYSFWEHEYRPRLAISLGLADSDGLKIPLLGDLRLLRRDVIHHQGFVTKDTATKLSVLAGFQEGAEINFTDEDIEALIRRIKAAMDELVVQVGGPDPLHRTLWHVQ